MDFAPTQHSRFPLQGQNQLPSAVQLHPALQQHLMAGYMPQQMQGQPMQPQGGMQKGIPRGQMMGTGGGFQLPPNLHPAFQPPQVPTGQRLPPRM